MMDHIRQRDWNSTKNVYDRFVDEQGIDNCVVERIIRNKFWDPMISSDEEEPLGPIDWDSIFATKSSKQNNYRRVVPGYRKPPPHPKLSALTREEHRHFIKVLSAQNDRILPHEFVGKPTKTDLRIFEEKKEIYAKEQEEYLEWARQLWTTTYCIRALRPTPLVEAVYEAEYKMKTHMIQSFPKSYALAAQIPLRTDNHTCDIVFPKMDLLKVNIAKLPQVSYPNIYESKEIILRKCPMPEPCSQHPCRFRLPNETEPSLLPLTEIHKELAQYALENGSEFVASEDSIRCLLEIDRTWSLPLSVCEVIGPDGDKSNVVVLGNEYPDKKDPAPMRSYRAFRHLLLHAFTEQSSKTKSFTEHTDYSPMHLRSHQPTKARTIDKKSFLTKSTRVPSESHKTAVAYNNAVRRVAGNQDSDSDDDGRLEIVIDDNNQNTSEIDDENHNNMVIDTNGHGTNNTEPRKILKARHRLSADRKIDTENVDVNMDSEETSHKENQESLNTCNSKIVTTSNGHESSQNDPESNKMDVQCVNETEAKNQLNGQEEQLEIALHDCVCKDTEFEYLSPRSYRNLLIKNNTTKDQLNLIVHCSHKLKNESCCEVLLEPILEYQLEVGATLQSPQKIQSLAFSLMLRKKAELSNIRLDGTCGEVVTMETMNLREFTSRHGDCKPDVANTIYTALNQLAGLLPGAYLLKHEPSHGVNGLLYSRASGCADAGGVPLVAADFALTPAQEARLVHAAPALRPVFLPIHKYHRQVPLAFTYNANQVAKENKSAAKKKTPPAALQWPKKKGKKKGKNKNSS